MNSIATYHRDHAVVLLDGHLEWPLVHEVVNAIETAVDYYHYALIELRVRSLGGSNQALRYLLERMDVWRGAGIRFRTRALGRTSSAAALLVALGDERVADLAATLRFHGSSMYRRGDINAAEAQTLHDKLSSADRRMVARLVERAFAGSRLPGEHRAEDSDREVVEGLCAGADQVPPSDPDRLQTLATALGRVVDNALLELDSEPIRRLYMRLCQIDRPASGSLARTLRLIDRVGGTGAVSLGAGAEVPSDLDSLLIPFALPTGELARETLTRHVLVLGDDVTSATRLCLAPLVAALARAPAGEVGSVLVLDPSGELRALIQTLAPDGVLELRPDSLVLDLMSGSRELAFALDAGRWIRAAFLVIERTLSLVPRSPARVLLDTSARVVEPVVREGLSLAVSAVGFVAMLLSAPTRDLEALLCDPEVDHSPSADIIKLARGAEGERGPNLLSLASWLLGVVPGLLPARTAKAAWDRFGKPGSEERDVHRGLAEGGSALSSAGDHARAVLAVAQAILSPFATPDARRSVYFGCEPGAKQADALDLAAIVSGAARARFLVHVPRDDSSGSLLATAIKTSFFEAVLDAPERGSTGGAAPLFGYIARNFERYVSADDRRFMDHARGVGAFAGLASQSVAAIEHALRDLPDGEGLVAHVLSAAGTKVLLRSTHPRTTALARDLAPSPPGQPHLLDERPLTGLGPDECYVSAPDGRFQRRRLAPWTEEPSASLGPRSPSSVVYLGNHRSDPPGGDAP